MVLGKVNGNILLHHYNADYYFVKLWDALRYIIIFSILMLVLAILYNLIPSRRLSWRGVLPGALFSTIGFAGCSEGFAYYINNFNSYARIYGSIGVVIIFMTWLFFISVILLIGGEINATLFLKK
jgi:membrane protein